MTTTKNKTKPSRTCNKCNSELTVPRARTCQSCKDKATNDRKELRKQNKLLELQQEVDSSDGSLTLYTTPSGKVKIVNANCEKCDKPKEKPNAKVCDACKTINRKTSTKRPTKTKAKVKTSKPSAGRVSNIARVESTDSEDE